MRLFFTSLLFFLTTSAFAGTADIYGGFGLTGGQSQFVVSEPQAATSKFSTLGYLVESGITMGNKWGFQGSAELGQLQSNNLISSNTYMEAATNTFYSAKLGMFFSGPSDTGCSCGFGFGLGYRLSNWKIKSLSIDNNSYNEIKYKGTDSIIYADLNLETSKRYRTTVEVQYITGKLKSADSSIADFKLSEMLLSLRFFVLFN